MSRMSIGAPRRALLLPLLALAGALALCAPLALAASQRGPEPGAQLAAARERWQARPHVAYRITSRSGECLQRGEFRANTIVHISRQPCFDSIRTVERLFDLVELSRGWGLASSRCATPGCICRETRQVYAVFDETLGYPRAIRLRKIRSVDWAALAANPAGYQSALGCASPPDIDLVTVLSVELVP